MKSGRAPIGFEGILPDQTTSHIGFEQYEDEQNKSATPVYPLGMISNKILLYF
jgi:hypothetical protein